MEKLFKFECGDVLKDKVSGFVGVVMTRSEYYTGCIHYGLEARKLTKDNKLADWQFLDEMRLTKVRVKPLVFKKKEGVVKGRVIGGPMPNPPTKH